MKKSTNRNSQPPDLMPIGKAAEQAGVSKQSLQYYIMVGLLEPTKVTASGRRMFDNDAVDRVRLIKKLNKSGYPLRAIREVFMEREKMQKGNK